ncbi:MAG: STAS domain-containing protein [Anaerolineales bacterium]
MQIKVSTENASVPVTVIHIAGKIDSATYRIFQEEADKLIDNGARHILVDLAEVSYISSAGLRTLHNIFNKLRSLHKDVDDEELRKKMNNGAYKSPYVKVSTLAPQVKDAFELSGFETYIEVFETFDNAVKSF